ncbi:nucleolin-like isoform X2 [Acanthopagrus latus]|uniref:nucleolin-like isoform X2 n=1 Tax=Acanthopagrus latus TaxID=8177 RepID=UPI00187CBD33|nr:nucleolin-like isoform X2 [Acanthopagrus latus]XP_036943961.1 nucleolin-like isoform X2 [Acanthopagrus latus]
MSKDQVVLKAVGTALGLLGAAAVGGLAAVFSNMRTPVEQHLHPIELSGDDQEEETEEEESEQTGGELKKDSQQAEQTGGEQEEEQRDDEDKERDQEEEEDDREEETEEEESDSEEETEKEESEQTEGEQEDEQRDGEDEERDQCEINQTPPGTIKLGLLNVRSMTKKENVISELITRNKLDLLLINETWVKPKRLKVLHKASPKRYKAHYRVRPGKKKGGGVANLFSEALQRKPKSSDSPDKKIKTTTFEFVVTELQHDDWNQPVLIINLYHPPGNSKEEFRKFLDEFQSLLDEVEKKYSSFIVTGDFNIHVNKEWRSDTDEFDSLLLVNDLTQHVNEPTHKAGNTLDLVITRNVEISGLKVRNEKNVVKSDHYTVYFYAKPEGTGEKTEENKNEEQKSFRQTEE